MRWLALGVLVLAGCTQSPLSETVGSSGTEQEGFAITETARFASKLGVKVHGELSDTVYPQPDGKIAGAWYSKGVVYWYRPYLVKAEFAWITMAAAHEVCHAVEYNHNSKHEECIQRLI